MLCWKSKNGNANNNCIEVFFAFREVLAKRGEYYLKNYGLIPTFKAGGHIGRTTVAEVGVLKREIAYHGDVLNTAARIQGKCNELEQQLIISTQLMETLQTTDTYKFNSFRDVHLQGKEEVIYMVGVEKTIFTFQ